jgi:hypothetical protein
MKNQIKVDPSRAAIKRTKADGEYRLRLFIDGEYQAGADYFTADLEDAKLTAEHMINNAYISDKECETAIDEQADYDEERIDGDQARSLGILLEDGSVTPGQSRNWNACWSKEIAAKMREAVGGKCSELLDEAEDVEGNVTDEQMDAIKAQLDALELLTFIEALPDPLSI